VTLQAKGVPPGRTHGLEGPREVSAGLMAVPVTADIIDTEPLPTRHSRLTRSPMLPASNVPSGSQVAARDSKANPALEMPVREDLDIISLAGRGTFADVWQVRDRRTGRVLALKELRTDRDDPPAARRILENEAAVAVKIDSTHVVKVLRNRLEAKPPYLLLEWLSGKTLEARLTAEHRLFCRDALWIARQCAQGLHALLVAGYAHGDIKPSNIFLLDDGTVKLIDLGFARADRRSAADLAGNPAATLSGTPEYLAPEALVAMAILPGDSGAVARDVYSLGVTLYRMLAGALPFQCSTTVEVLRQHQGATPRILRSLAPDVPREVGELVQRLLAKQPLRRGEGLSSLIHDLVGLELSLLAAESGPVGRDVTVELPAVSV
jgi:serine/threonine protein kinase